MVTTSAISLESLGNSPLVPFRPVPSCTKMDPVAPSNVPSGWIAGRYEIVRPLGSGGSADAFEGRDAFDASRVTIKVLRDRSTERFFRAEASRLRDLYHPNLPRVRDVGIGEHPFFVTDFIDGRALDASVDPTRVLVDVLRALAFVHDLGIRHGDVSPGNILVCDDRVVLIDFGCADACGPVSHVSGTPGFVAPELLEGRADGRADVYTLGQTVLSLGFGTVPDVVATMVRDDPRERPTAREALIALGEPAPLGPPGGRAARTVGRKAELAALRTHLDECNAGRARPLVLTGVPGVGRTRLLQATKWLSAVPCVEVRDELGPWGALEALLEQPLPTGYEGWCVALEEIEKREMAMAVIADDLSATSLERLLAVRSRWVLPVVVTSRHELDVENVEHVELGPLDRAALHEWIPDATDAEIDRLMSATGGYPADVEAALTSVAAGERTLLDLDPRGSLTPPREPELQQALARIAVGSEASADATLRLQSLGWVCLRDGRVALRRPGDRRRLHEEMTDAMRAAHAERLDVVETSAERVWHLAGSGRYTEAAELARQCSFEDVPHAWPSVLEGWAPASHRARAERIAGRPDRALETCREEAEPDQFEWRLEVALAYLGVGDGSRALRHARRAESLASDATEHALAADAIARALLRRTEYAEAMDVASRALERAPAAVRASLSERVGVARMYLGDLKGAHRALGAAERTHASPRERIRLCSYRAIARFRAGDLAQAQTAYREARRLAEAHGLPDLLATAAMNEATVLQQLGDWGNALRGYERALRLARALGRESTERALRFNLANLNLALGRGEVAASHLDALRGELPRDVEVAARTVRAELARFAGDLDRARGEAREARLLAEQADQRREADEALLLEIELGEPGDLDALIERLDADLRARARALRGTRWLDEGRAMQAFQELEAALSDARAVGERDVIARIAAQCARAAQTAGATELCERLQTEARTIWERIALTLDAPLRESFWAHPMRMTRTREPKSVDVSRIDRLLQLNGRINSSLATARVLEHAIDAAIELVGAERGFVLLAEDDDTLRVAVARNLDHERIGRSKLKFSHSIAERVLRSGHPIVTHDARADERFAEQRSVHAMRLTSVACVPIESPRGQLGALYLDHRFTPGCFDESDVHLLQALSDQVAIALDNAALTEALEKRTHELEGEKAKVERLLAEREAQLEVDRAELERLRGDAAPPDRDYRPLTGNSDAMRRVFALLDRVVDSNLSVLILGESGTGKELVARALHRLGAEAHLPMLSVNCAAVPENLLESELFGHVRGAFTGADRDRAGLFAEARGGVVFLDEVGEMPLAMQAKLLRVLQEREVRPVGGARTIPVEFRLLAATNRDLRARVEAGEFRQDLYYRLAVVEVELPALRERRSDLPMLIDSILEKLAREQGRDVPRIDRDAMRLLQGYEWPGNVRELENVLARALVLGSDVIVAEDLGLAAVRRRAPRTRESFEKSERERIGAILEQVGWNVSEAARRLEMPRNTLYRRMKRYGLHR